MKPDTLIKQNDRKCDAQDLDMSCLHSLDMHLESGETSVFT